MGAGALWAACLALGLSARAAGGDGLRERVLASGEAVARRTAGGRAAVAELERLAALAGCAPVERMPVAPGPEAGAPLELERDTQATVGDLRLALGYVRKGEYADAQGASRRGLVAGLWVYVRGAPAEDRKLEVHAGQTFEAGGRSILVEAVRGGGRAAVSLRVAERR